MLSVGTGVGPEGRQAANVIDISREKMAMNVSEFLN
jgi:hypothetical protein